MSRTDGAIVRLEITSKGQVALKKEVLDHLGVEPGDYVDIDREVNFIYRDRRSEASKIFPVH
jgi:bifunctional DNA-binding transcriptional regulator/antitoxin component of YhaV-PrlF toxin-antitoxin module